MNPPVAKTAQAVPGSEQERLVNLDVLRAVAALLVCLHHFDRGDEPALGLISAGGYLGVNIFFVLSGFVIPLSLHRSGFRYRDTGTFYAARLIRLYPAYLAAAVLAVGLHYVSTLVPGFAGNQPAYTWKILWTNATLTSDLLGQPWIVPIFWTLAIEAQFYVLVALSFPLLVARPPWSAVAVLAAWILAPLVLGIGATVFTWTALFALGIVTFLYREALLPACWALPVFAAAAAVEVFMHGWASASIGVGTAAFVAFGPRIRSRGLVAIGAVSYSLYLIHTLIGGRVINFTSRLPDYALIHWLALALAVLLSLAAATVLYYLVEKPSHALSRRFRPRAQRARHSPADVPSSVG